MKVAGIIAEYNPFHKGHQYHIEETRKQTGADYVIAVMSGDYVQRGEPAIADKYMRTRMALSGGVDLVIEMPVIYATASAEYFATAGIGILDRLGCVDYLSFGSEWADVEDYSSYATLFLEEPEEYRQILQEQLKRGKSFPEARAFTAGKLLFDSKPETAVEFLKEPNHILGLEYIKALRRRNSSIQPITVKRKGNHYHEKILAEEYSSATSIRRELYQYYSRNKENKIFSNKNNEKMTVTINGGGPIGTMMAVTRGDGHIKGFVGDPHVHYTYNDTGHLAVGVAVGTQGTLQVIRDMGLKEPFCGTVPLQTGEIGDDFSYYFMASEQTPSVVSVGVLVDETNEILSSGGFIIQLLPEATEEDISYIEEKIKDFPAVSSLIHEGKTPEEILKMLFEDVEITDHQDLFFTCDCSREKMINALSTIGKQELQSMIDEDHGCEITCQFCNTKYQFSEEELQNLINRL